MAVLAECPICHRKQSAKNKVCKCGEDLDKAKRSKKVEFWIDYRVPGGRQLRQHVGTSIEEARDADGKRRTQKREHRIFDMLPEATMTFRELAEEWYLTLEEVKKLASYKTRVIYLNKFNRDFGDRIVNTITVEALRTHQIKREREGNKPKTIDDELNYVKTMIINAYDNKKVGPDIVDVFRKVKRKLEVNTNRRTRTLTVQEFEELRENSPRHLQDILIMGYWTGMRKGEILPLTWNKVDLRERFARLEASDTKEEKPKTVPLGEEVIKMLTGRPIGIHDGRVFLYNGKGIEKRFETAMKSACEKAGITWGREEKGGFIFHDLRRTFITEMRRAGVQESVIMSITGHSIKTMNQRYDAVEDWEKLGAIKKLEDYRKELLAKVDQTVDLNVIPASNILKFKK
jgi:integrase